MWVIPAAWRANCSPCSRQHSLITSVLLVLVCLVCKINLPYDPPLLFPVLLVQPHASLDICLLEPPREGVQCSGSWMALKTVDVVGVVYFVGLGCGMRCCRLKTVHHKQPKERLGAVAERCYQVKLQNADRMYPMFTSS